MYTDSYQPTFSVNGIEFKEVGEEKEFTSSDGSIKTTVTPMSIKVDITKANINKTLDESLVPSATTIADIVDDMNADTDFTTYTYEDEVVYENEVSYDDEEFTISHTYYYKDYYYVSLPYEDDVIFYEVSEIKDFDEAEQVSSNYFFADYILRKVLVLNGYSLEEVGNFLASDNEFNYEINGVEIQELGKSIEYTKDDTTLTVGPMSIKIDLARANIEKSLVYDCIDGDNQEYDGNGELSFEFDIDFDTFEKEGKVYVNDELVSNDNYKKTKGSTIITFNSEYAKKLATGKYTVKASISTGSATANFNVIGASVDNPNTLDNITLYISLLGVAIISVISLGIYSKKCFE